MGTASEPFGYFLRGTNGDAILVIRSTDPESLLRVINDLQETKNYNGMITKLLKDYHGND